MNRGKKKLREFPLVGGEGKWCVFPHFRCTSPTPPRTESDYSRYGILSVFLACIFVGKVNLFPIKSVHFPHPHSSSSSMFLMSAA